MMVKLKSCRWKQEWSKYSNNNVYIHGVVNFQISTNEEGDFVRCQ